MGIVVLVPIADAFSTSAPPSTEEESTTTQLPSVNPVPTATVSTVAPATLRLPVAVVFGLPTVNWYGCSQPRHRPTSREPSPPVNISWRVAAGPHLGHTNKPAGMSRGNDRPAERGVRAGRR